MGEILVPLQEVCSSQVIHTWHRFVEFGEKAYGISENVMLSWERSKEMKVDAYGGKSNILLTAQELNWRLNQYENLISISLPYINNILMTIHGLGYLVFLTDSEGNILYVAGDKDVLEDFSLLYNFRVGVSWSERAVGTTAVSMVISEGKSVPFMSEEKFCYELKKRACSAVPIKNIDDRMIAVLGIAANFPTPNYQLAGILSAAEMAIENHLRLTHVNDKFRVVNEYYKALFDSVSDAIVVVDNCGIITAINQKATSILRESPGKIIGKEVKEILGFYPVILETLKTGKEFHSANNLVDTKNSRMKYSIKRVKPVLDCHNRIDGCINIIEQVGTKRNCDRTKFTFADIVGKSKGITEVIKQAEVAAENDLNVLITGESGTGKDVIAQAIHNASSRAGGPYIAINCGAIPKELIESEFFGFEAGAFTGANKHGFQGKFEQADGGTIFLDEIGEMPKNLQIRLLRVLQDKEITRIGGIKTISLDVRVIAATNKDLPQEIHSGHFREDLFWRLNVIQIQIPSLSQRKGDIPELVRHFIIKYSKTHDMDYTLDKDTIHILENYSWPGNVRELENVIERALAFADGSTILPQMLPDYLTSSKVQIDITKNNLLDETEKRVIENVIIECEGNMTKAAKRLGISRPTLYRKMKQEAFQPIP